MNLEQQVCSLELSKKLVTLGVNNNSLWIWFRNRQSNEDFKIVYISNDENPIWYRQDGKQGICLVEYYPAFTASELLDKLPNRITLIEGDPFNSFILLMQKSIIINLDNDVKCIPNYFINYRCDTISLEDDVMGIHRYLFANNLYDENVCNALAKCLIKLIEEGFIKKNADTNNTTR